MPLSLLRVLDIDSNLTFTPTMTLPTNGSVVICQDAHEMELERHTINIQGEKKYLAIVNNSLAPGPHAGFHCLQYRKAWRAWYLFSSEHDNYNQKLAHHRYWLTGYEEPGLSDHKLIYGELADRVEHICVTSQMI